MPDEYDHAMTQLGGALTRPGSSVHQCPASETPVEQRPGRAPEPSRIDLCLRAMVPGVEEFTYPVGPPEWPATVVPEGSLFHGQPLGAVLPDVR